MMLNRFYDHLWLLHSDLTAHKKRRQAGTAAGKANFGDLNIWFVFWRGYMTRYSGAFLGLMISYWTQISSWTQVQCRNQLCFVFEATGHKQRSAVQHFLVWTCRGTRFCCPWIMPMDLRRFKIAHLYSPSDCASSSYLWQLCLLIYASNSLSSIPLVRPSLCRLSTLKGLFLKR